jgi:hypothetical protein
MHTMPLGGCTGRRQHLTVMLLQRLVLLYMVPLLLLLLLLPQQGLCRLR